MITEHTLRVLEYDRLVELVAHRTQSARGREHALALRPFDDPTRLRLERDAVAEALALCQSESGYPSTAHDDLASALRMARVEGARLEPTDLLRVARTLRVVRSAKTALERGPVGPRLSDLGEALVPSRDLETRITHAIGPTGEILDGASPKLARLRRQELALRQSIQDRLGSLLSGLDLRDASDAYVTQRGDRYVIPVPAGDRGKVRGIVHDQSASGHTHFIEPFAAVEDNNGLARCKAETRAEETRIVTELSARVVDFRESLEENARVLARLDYLGAVARFGSELGMVLADMPESAAGGLRLVGARHPLMLAQLGNPEHVVPLCVTLEDDQRILILTGPNMGGKTVALKTIGLSALMTMSALPISASPGTTIPYFRSVSADIGDEQSISDNLSTFASHLKHLAAFLAEKTEPALVLLDELGTGTDPAEGGALARAYLEALDGPGAWVIATTHLTTLKEFAAAHPNAVNGSMAFDEETLTPRFALELGTPGRSRAIEVAERLAFPGAVLGRARALLGADERQMDRLLAEVEAQRERVRELEVRASREATESAARLKEAERREAEARRLLAEAKSRAAEEAQSMLREAESLVKETRRSLTREDAAPSRAEVEDAGRRVREKQRETDRLRQPVREEKGTDYPAIARGEIGPGVDVWSIDLEAVVTADEVPSGRGVVHVVKSGIRFAVSADRLRRVPTGRQMAQAPKGAPARGGVSTNVGDVDAVPPELDLRGLNGADATAAVERYLDNALLAGVNLVRVIHGKGTGVLRQRVVEVLSKHFGVLEFRAGQSHEGGAGVTIAHLGER